VIDIDLDGWPDLCFARGGDDASDPSGSLPNQLFRNLEGKRFSDVTEASGVGDRGYSQGITVADINQDGFPDLPVANIGPNMPFLNHGDGTFDARRLALDGKPDEWTFDRSPLPWRTAGDAAADVSWESNGLPVGGASALEPRILGQTGTGPLHRTTRLAIGRVSAVR
jgi:hypothetical protein